MKLLVVGFGKMGMLHAATLRMLPGVSDVLIAESSPLLRRGIAVFAPGARVVADWREALTEKNLAGAVIATPTASHIPLVRELAPHVRGIFVEKPLATHWDEASAAARELPKGVSVMTGHCLRFSPVFVEAKRLLDAGVLGKIERFEATMFSSDVLKPAKSWRFKGAKAGGGVLLDLGSHMVDMTRYFFGTPDRLVGRVQSIVSAAAEDAFETEWSYASGLKGKLTGSWSKPECRKASLAIHVFGSNGQMDVFDDAVELDLRTAAGNFSAGKNRLAITSLEGTVPFDLAGPMYTRQLEAWVRSLEGKTFSTNTLEENLVNLRLLDAIRSSNGNELSGFERVKEVQGAAR